MHEHGPLSRDDSLSVLSVSPGLSLEVSPTRWVGGQVPTPGPACSCHEFDLRITSAISLPGVPTKSPLTRPSTSRQLAASDGPSWWVADCLRTR